MKNTVERTLYYYEMNFRLFSEAEKLKRNYTELIELIEKYCLQNSELRFIKKKEEDENKIGVFDFYKFENESNKIGFKLIKIRKDVFPQLMNDNGNSLEDLQDVDEKSVVEATHIILDYQDDKVLRLVIEYNSHGPRMSDFIFFIRELGKKEKLCRSVNTTIIVNNKLEEVANKIGRCKSLKIKVLEENVEKVKSHNQRLGSALETLSNFSKSNYYKIDLRLDFEKNDKSNKDVISNFIKIFSKDKSSLDCYNSFQIEAEDTTNDDEFTTFDLLMDKVKSKIKPNRKENSKVIISDSIYKLMLEEYVNKIV